MYFLSFLLFILTFLFIIFFRDPDREIGKGIVAVADGKIRSIQKKQDDYVGNSLFISTFMNIYNVHVNRVPIDGTVLKIIHIPGSNLPAFTKESERNERIIYQMETSIGPVKIIQIAGTLARRIIPYIYKSDMVKKGQKLGIIRLGSRVDIYLPANAIKKNIIEEGQFVKAGVDCLAEIHD
jgi:phosphatidylserine decarboxylase